MTKTLSLLRHAKSGWDDPVAKDLDRPLNRKGEKAAKMMGKWLAAQNINFDGIIASPAVRVIETLDNLSTGFGKRLETKWERRIYLASGATLMDVLKETDDSIHHILMVGHNPGMEDIILDLVPDTSGDALREKVWSKYPTAAYAQLNLNIESWHGLKANVGILDIFKRPRDLDSALGPDEY